MTSDSFHTYTYDAEGNVTQVDRGATAIYSYNALNQRVRIDKGATAIEFVFNLNGQRTSEWDGHSFAQLRGPHYMGARPLAYYDSSTHFQHLDYLGAARVQTSYNGAGEGAYSSLPFGDAFSDTNGAAQFYGNGSSDDDAYHFAALDHDSETDTDHAQFRNYSPTQGRWLTPDPYDGSYDLTNPQSLNRFTYVGNNPLTFTDPSGQFTNGATGEGGGCDLLCDVITLGVGGLIDGLEALFGGGSSFHGTLTPRPQSTGVPDWGDDPGSFGESLGIGSNLKTGSWGIAPALGLPDAGCEFGACGSSFQNPVMVGGAAATCIEAEPCGAIAGTIIGLDMLYQIYKGTRSQPTIEGSSRQEQNLLNFIARAYCVDRKALGELIHQEKVGRPRGKGSDLTQDEIRQLARLLPKLPGCTPTAH